MAWLVFSIPLGIYIRNLGIFRVESAPVVCTREMSIKFTHRARLLHRIGNGRVSQRVTDDFEGGFVLIIIRAHSILAKEIL